jgi:hypothetical protein
MRPSQTATALAHRAVCRRHASSQASVREEAGNSTHVGVMHLRSHEHMGQAELTCVSGCTCDPFRINGSLDWKASQEFHAAWPVTRSGAGRPWLPGCPPCAAQLSLTPPCSPPSHAPPPCRARRRMRD